MKCLIIQNQKEADHNSHLIIEQVGEPGQDEGSPADAEDGGHVSGGQLAVGAPDNHHRDLASTALHHNQGDDCQPGEEVVVRKSILCTIIKLSLPQSCFRIASLYICVRILIYHCGD